MHYFITCMMVSWVAPPTYALNASIAASTNASATVAQLQPAASQQGTPIDIRLQNVVLYTSNAKPLFGKLGYIHWRDNLIVAIQADKPPPPESTTTILDGQGMVLTPGIIDAHSHLGVYSLPHVDAHEDGNEATNPITPDMRACDALRDDDPTIDMARAYGGITTALVLPGSANLIGGQACVVKLRRLPGARGLARVAHQPIVKLACGENPKRVYGARNQLPGTRMGNLALLRRKFKEAQQKNDKSHSPELEILQAILAGKIAPHVHCYTAMDMHNMLDLAASFGFHIAAFHHAVEAFRLADRLQAEQVGVATWVDWWGFKMEARQPSFGNVGLLEQQEVVVAIHSDSEREMQHLHQEAAKGQAAARQMHIPISNEQAMAWITKNPAMLLGIEQLVGSLEVGKHADMVLWDREPLDSRARPVAVWVDGMLAYSLQNPVLSQPMSKPPFH